MTVEHTVRNQTGVIANERNKLPSTATIFPFRDGNSSCVTERDTKSFGGKEGMRKAIERRRNALRTKRKAPVEPHRRYITILYCHSFRQRVIFVSLSISRPRCINRTSSSEIPSRSTDFILIYLVIFSLSFFYILI